MLLGANSCLNSKTIILFMLIVKTHKTKRKWSKRRSMPRDCCGFCCWFWLCFKSIGIGIIFCFSFLHTLYHLLFFPHIIFHLWWEEHKTTTTSIILFPTWFSNGKKKSPFSYRVYFDRFQDIVLFVRDCSIFFSFHFIPSKYEWSGAH